MCRRLLVRAACLLRPILSPAQYKRAVQEQVGTLEVFPPAWRLVTHAAQGREGQGRTGKAGLALFRVEGLRQERPRLSVTIQLRRLVPF